MASGSHTKSGICALLPVAPMKSRRTTHATQPGAAPASRPAANVLMVSKSSPPSSRNSRNMPSRKAKSPTRLTMNALLAAALFLRSVNQKPMSRYEHSPTPSQPRNSTGRLSPRTRLSMAKMNRLRYAKNFQYPGSPCM